MATLSSMDIQKRIREKHLLDNQGIRKVINKISGEKMDRDKSGKVLTKILRKWDDAKSQDTKDEILRKSGLSKFGSYSSARKKIDEAFGDKKLSNSELKKLKEIQLKRIKYNIATSVKSAESEDFGKLVGQRVGPGGKIRRSFFSGAQKEPMHMSMSGQFNRTASVNSNAVKSKLSVHATTSLSVNKNANSITGALGASNNAMPGIGLSRTIH